MISLKSKREIEIMKEGAQKLSFVMGELRKIVKPGIKTKDLDNLARGLIKKVGASPNFLGYGSFPAAICTSVNETVVHGVPSDYELKEGDIISIDGGLLWKGFHTDMAFTVGVGKIDPEAARLIKATKKSLKLAIKKVRVGNTVGDIGNTIERYVESQGFSVVKELCGHGIGKELHEDPQVLNFGKRHRGEKLKEGMVICIEPMVAFGSGKVVLGRDGFSYETIDGLLSAHFEHMIAIVNGKAEVLTEWIK